MLFAFFDMYFCAGLPSNNGKNMHSNLGNARRVCVCILDKARAMKFIERERERISFEKLKLCYKFVCARILIK